MFLRCKGEQTVSCVSWKYKTLRLFRSFLRFVKIVLIQTVSDEVLNGAHGFTWGLNFDFTLILRFNRTVEIEVFSFEKKRSRFSRFWQRLPRFLMCRATRSQNRYFLMIWSSYRRSVLASQKRKRVSEFETDFDRKARSIFCVNYFCSSRHR